MNRDEMRSRTKQFALRVIRLSTALPRNRTADILARQLLRSATSVGANYRESLRASSRRHFTTILETALREADESSYWLELICDSGLMKPARLQALINECNQLVAILSATARTAKRQGKVSEAKKSQIPNPKS